MPFEPHQFVAEIKQFAREIGFDLVGVASAEASSYREYFRQWLDDGKSGSMAYLANRFAERVDPRVYVPGAASVICVGMNYQARLEESVESSGKPGRAARESVSPLPVNRPSALTLRLEEGRVRDGVSGSAKPPPQPSPELPVEGVEGAPAPRGRIARYALGDDYHEVIKARLWKLADWIRQRVPEAMTRACVDTAPVMEKELAVRAGIGWMGKNTCVIHPQIGSWLLLGEVITTLALPADDPQFDRCGTCRRCIDACPTQAITEPYQLDARRCISYLTIEQREAITPDLAVRLDDWLYGCDICQEVCPWNNKAPFTSEPAFAPRFADGQLNLAAVMNWTSEDYSRTLKGSAMKRVKLPILQRNARLILENQKQTSR
jgi:epoxyqueuosine reductase